MKKLFKYMLLSIIAIILFQNNKVYAYMCEYSGSGTAQIEGCGNFTIEVSKGKLTTQNNVKFSTSGMQINEFTITEGWKNFATYLNGECPEVYYRKNKYGNYCDINLGFGDFDYSKYNDYIIGYGTNLSDPSEPEPVVPEENIDEIYYTPGIEGHVYTDAGGCIYGEPRNVYVEAAKKTIIACVASKAGDKYALPMISTDDPEISCGYSQYHDTFKATMKNGKITNIDKDGGHFYSGVCYGVSIDPNYNSDDNSTEPPEINTDLPDLTKCNYLLGYPDDPGSPAYYLLKAFHVIKYVALVLLVVLSVMDFTGAIAKQDKDAMAKVFKKLMMRFILCIIIFLLPYFINLLLKYLVERQTDLCGIK